MPNPALTQDLVSNSETALSTAEWTLKLGEGGLAEPDLSPEEIEALKTVGIPAAVPGNVYNALLDADLIPNPFIGTNEQDLHWIARQNWIYSAKLPEHPEASHYDLVFYGLDTVAEVRLGEQTVANTEDMHLSYDFDVTEAVAGGANDLEIVFTSPYSYTDASIAELGKYPGAYEEPYNHIRKMACNYGWDWGPTVVTAGLWRDAVLVAWDHARFTSTRISAGVDWDASKDDRVVGTVSLSGSVELDPSLSADSFTVRYVVSKEGETVLGGETPVDAEGRFSADLKVDDVELWWPHTLGDQPLYDISVELLSAEGTVEDARYERIGFRSVELANEPSTDPEKAAVEGRFGLVVNRKDTFARGWNWIPNDPLVDRVTEEDYRERLVDVRDSGADWVRVWGGGIFEDDVFYDVCDEMGILVWQDFPFACASYPETAEIEELVRAEAVDNVERLMSHPSLGVWNGNNENFMGYESWGWSEQLGGKGWGGKYYLETIPSVIAEIDPSRPYWPGSPYSGVEGQLDNDPNYGSIHSWECWNRLDYSHYLDTDPLFMAEFGWQSPPAWSTLVNAVDAPEGATELDLDSPEVLNHQKAIGGMDKLTRGVSEHFGSDALVSTAAWHYLTQIVQARAIATGVGHWRSLWPRCEGAFIWQINDCWPVISWAGVDSDGHRKPMWYTAKQAFADRLVYLKEVEGAVTAFLINQSEEPWDASLVESLVKNDGTIEASNTSVVAVEPSSVSKFPLMMTIRSPRSEMLVVDVEDQREVWLAVPDYDFQYPEPSYVGELAAADRGDSRSMFEADGVVADEDGAAFTLTVVAESLIRELVLQADRIHPALVASAAPVTLLPGEQRQWTIGLRPGTSPEDAANAIAALEDAEWSFPVLASVGDILAK